MFSLGQSCGECGECGRFGTGWSLAHIFQNLFRPSLPGLEEDLTQSSLGGAPSLGSWRAGSLHVSLYLMGFLSSPQSPAMNLLGNE